MTLKALAAELAQRVKEVISHEAEPLLTKKAMAEYGRKLEDGCIALRVLIIANESAGDLGKMELFIPVSKAALNLKGNQDNVFASVMRFIMQVTQYRAEMIGRVRDRQEAAAA